MFDKPAWANRFLPFMNWPLVRMGDNVAKAYAVAELVDVFRQVGIFPLTG
jgi:hypothetical protein